MQTEAFLALSMRLIKDLNDWDTEISRRGGLSTQELTILRNAVAVIQKATMSAAPVDPNA